MRLAFVLLGLVALSSAKGNLGPDEDFFADPASTTKPHMTTLGKKFSQPPHVRELHPSLISDGSDQLASSFSDEDIFEPSFTWGINEIDEKPNTVHDEKLEEELMPLTPRKWATFFLGAFFLIIAAGGGIGGGGILVPLYAIVLGFELHHAVPLSNMTICASAITNLAFNINARHPKADRPLIDWNLILVMEPLTIAGALVGSLLNVMLPSWAVTIMLVVLLLLTGYRSIQKGTKKYQAECAAMERKKCDTLTDSLVESGQNVDPSKQPVTCCGGKNNNKPEDPSEVDNHNIEPVEKARRDELNQMLHSESVFPWAKCGALLFIFAVVLLLEMGRGGHGKGGNPLGIACGSAGYWFITFAVLPFTFLALVLTRHYLLSDYRKKARLNYEYQSGDVVWDEVATVKYPAICALAGLFAGLFGIGGGIVKGPLMLEMNVRPDVAAATSATMILFTSAAAGISFSLYGAVAWQYVMVMAPIGIVATAIGQTAINRLIAKYNHPSYIIFCIAAVVILSAFAMATFGIMNIATSSSHELVRHLTVIQKLCGH